jgi:2-iminobutanoate/2-iminopropanoate deaminase
MTSVRSPAESKQRLKMQLRCAGAAHWACAAITLAAMTGCAVNASKQPVSTAEAPAAIGPYSQAIKFGRMLFLAGQIALDPKTNELRGSSIEEQTQQVIENLRAVLKANGMGLENVVSTTVYLADLNEFSKMNSMYATYFKEAPPARATVQVTRLPRDARVEIAAIAMK